MMVKKRFPVFGFAVSGILVMSVLMLAGCGSGSAPEPFVLANPEWRAAMPANVSFPLPEPVTITVGMGGGSLDEMSVLTGAAAGVDSGAAAESGSQRNISLEWLGQHTNVNVAVVGLPTSPGDILLGEMIREGRLPDILPEGRFDLRQDENRAMFVNILEFPALIPNIAALQKSDPDFRAALLRKYAGNGELYAAGTYNPSEKPFAGVLAFREDIFREYNLSHATWEELYASLKLLKSLYPETYPFGGTGEMLSTMGPAWFGSGYNSREIIYFKPETGQWTFGPFEEEYREYLDYFRKLYAEGLLSPDYIMLRTSDLPRNWINQNWLIAPHTGKTGLQFPWRIDGYGSLAAEGEWDGSGTWVSAMKIPRNSDGIRGRISSSGWTNLGSGWLVNNQSPRAAEALAFLDLLYREDVSRVLSIGPEGILWEQKEGGPRFIGEITAPYNPKGQLDFADYLKEKNLSVGLPLSGMRYNREIILGLKELPYYQYYLKTDIGHYLEEGSIGLYPIPAAVFSETEWDEIAGITVALSAHIEAFSANYIIGRTGPASYEEFLAECRNIGAGRLTELYNRRPAEQQPAAAE